MIFGSGVGGVVICGGKVYYGVNLYGGEFGYMLMDCDGCIFSEFGIVVNVVMRIVECLEVLKVSIDGFWVFELCVEGNKIVKEELDMMFYYFVRSIFNL